MSNEWNEYRIKCDDAATKGYNLLDIGISIWEEISPDEIRFFSDLEKDPLLATLLTVGFADVVVSKLEQKNWTTMAPDLLVPKSISKVNIQPITSANEVPSDRDSETIYIIPGMGFGTGHHPTTEMAIEFIFDLSSTPKSILDLGTGSGILAIAAHRKFNLEIIGVDNDPYAIENAEENVRINNSNVALSVATIADLKESFDIIIANLYAELLIELAQEISSHLDPSGELILTGIMNSLEADVVSTYEKLGFEIVKTERRGGWSALKARRTIVKS